MCLATYDTTQETTEKDDSHRYNVTNGHIRYSMSSGSVQARESKEEKQNTKTTESERAQHLAKAKPTLPQNS